VKVGVLIEPLGRICFQSNRATQKVSRQYYELEGRERLKDLKTGSATKSLKTTERKEMAHRLFLENLPDQSSHRDRGQEEKKVVKKRNEGHGEGNVWKNKLGP